MWRRVVRRWDLRDVAAVTARETRLQRSGTRRYVHLRVHAGWRIAVSRWFVTSDPDFADEVESAFHEALERVPCVARPRERIEYGWDDDLFTSGPR
jgi:hypothetical protein